MDVLWFYAIAFVVIWGLAILFKDKLKIDINGPFLMIKTGRMRGFIDRIAQKSPRFWKYSMNVGIPVAVFFIGLIFYLLADSLISILATPAPSTQAAVGIAIPGVKIPGSPFYVPLGYGLAAIATVVVVHEFGHAILARAEGISIKSIGLALFAVIPGAFVEPDEEEVKKAKRLSKLRIYAAGSVFNMGFGAIALVGSLLLSMFFIAPSFHTDGMQITSIIEDSPADGVLKEGMIITGINGQHITNRTSFITALNATRPGNMLTITTNQGPFTLETAPNPHNPSIAYIGVQTQENLAIDEDVSNVYGDILPWLLFGFTTLLRWIFILNFGIGTFNLIPLKPFDGGLMLEELLNYITTTSTANKLTNIISAVSLMLIVMSIGYSLTSAFI
ncbi:MAG: site-2 protease family protein [Methanobacteriaceae archaeon]|jgi:membrane-associated protease RseP (regulator of RpoE activity)